MLGSLVVSASGQRQWSAAVVSASASGVVLVVSWCCLHLHSLCGDVYAYVRVCGRTRVCVNAPTCSHRRV